MFQRLNINSISFVCRIILSQNALRAIRHAVVIIPSQ